MRVAIFCHSIASDWNHGNAHFLRGIATELQRLGNTVDIFEPEDGWSRSNLLAEAGPQGLTAYRAAYPSLTSHIYRAATLDLERALEDTDLVLVHEWTDPKIISRLGRYRQRHHSMRLLFHDTHHRLASDPASIKSLDLDHYDGILAFGQIIRDLYLDLDLADRAWTWHEAADTRVFRPLHLPKAGQLIWIGNWGDEERTRELTEFLIEPARTQRLKTLVHGVRYPAQALALLADSHIDHGGYLPNHLVPQTFARHRVTVHIPRRPYARLLPGIPTIRVFEALACAIPLICAPWQDAERLFTPGQDYLVARNGQHMASLLQDVLHDPDLAASLAAHGLNTIHTRHTIAHRVNELLAIHAELSPQPVTPTVLQD